MNAMQHTGSVGADLDGVVIVRDSDLMVTLAAAQEWADTSGQDVIVTEEGAFFARIAPHRICLGCGSKEVGSTCTVCARAAARRQEVRDLWLNPQDVGGKAEIAEGVGRWYFNSSRNGEGS